jgi:hypothetical protein
MNLSLPLVLLLVLPAEDKPTPKLPLGKETTYVMGPLDDEGYIDYETALNERLGKGITPEKNANVLLWKALGPRPEGGEVPAQVFKWLCIEAPPKEGDYFVGMQAYLKDHVKVEPIGAPPGRRGEWEEIFDQQSRASQRPWRATDYPHVAAWLKANEKPLALVVEATKLPDYFNPLVSSKTGKGPTTLLDPLLPSAQKCREIASALAGRAMLRVAEGKVEEAWQDLLACHRLARLVGRGATLIEGLVGIAIDQIASNADVAWLDRVKPTAKQARDCLRDLQSLPPLPSMAEKIDLGERFMFLSSLQLIRSGGPGTLEGLAGGKMAKDVDPEMEQKMARIDWTPALRNGNLWYDRLVVALRTKDRAAREKQLDRIDKELRVLKKEATSVEGLGGLLLGNAGKIVGKRIGDILVGLMIPAFLKLQNAADRSEQVQANLHVAFALAAYRGDQGRYPAKLDELASKYLEAVPGDLFSGKALIYQPSGEGYLLYSVGVNGKDEGGHWFDDDPPGDDPRVRLPLPELKPKK